MRIFAMMQSALFESRSIVLEIPDRHVRRPTLRDGDDDVRKGRPRVIEVVLRRPRRMIRMRMVEADEVGAKLGGAALRVPIVRRPHEKTAARSLFGGVRQRERRADAPRGSVER